MSIGEIRASLHRSESCFRVGSFEDLISAQAASATNDSTRLDSYIFLGKEDSITVDPPNTKEAGFFTWLVLVIGIARMLRWGSGEGPLSGIFRNLVDNSFSNERVLSNIKELAKLDDDNGKAARKFLYIAGLKDDPSGKLAREILSNVKSMMDPARLNSLNLLGKIAKEKSGAGIDARNLLANLAKEESTAAIDAIAIFEDLARDENVGKEVREIMGEIGGLDTIAGERTRRSLARLIGDNNDGEIGKHAAILITNIGKKSDAVGAHARKLMEGLLEKDDAIGLLMLDGFKEIGLQTDSAGSKARSLLEKTARTSTKEYFEYAINCLAQIGLKETQAGQQARNMIGNLASKDDDRGDIARDSLYKMILAEAPDAVAKNALRLLKVIATGKDDAVGMKGVELIKNLFSESGFRYKEDALEVMGKFVIDGKLLAYKDALDFLLDYFIESAGEVNGNQVEVADGKFIAGLAVKLRADKAEYLAKKLWEMREKPVIAGLIKETFWVRSDFGEKLISFMKESAKGGNEKAIKFIADISINAFESGEAARILLKDIVLAYNLYAPIDVLKKTASGAGKAGWHAIQMLGEIAADEKCQRAADAMNALTSIESHDPDMWKYGLDALKRIADGIKPGPKAKAIEALCRLAAEDSDKGMYTEKLIDGIVKSGYQEAEEVAKNLFSFLEINKEGVKAKRLRELLVKYGLGDRYSFGDKVRTYIIGKFLSGDELGLELLVEIGANEGDAGKEIRKFLFTVIGDDSKRERAINCLKAIALKGGWGGLDAVIEMANIYVIAFDNLIINSSILTQLKEIESGDKGLIGNIASYFWNIFNYPKGIPEEGKLVHLLMEIGGAVNCGENYNAALKLLDVHNLLGGGWKRINYVFVANIESNTGYKFSTETNDFSKLDKVKSVIGKIMEVRETVRSKVKDRW